MKEITEKIMIDKKQLKNIEYFKYLGCMITNDSRCALKLNPGLLPKEAFNKKNTIYDLRSVSLQLYRTLSTVIAV